MPTSDNYYDKNVRLSDSTRSKNNFGHTIIELGGSEDAEEPENGSDLPDLRFENKDHEGTIGATPQICSISLTDPTDAEFGRIPDRTRPQKVNIPQSSKATRNAKSVEAGPNVFDDYHRKDAVPDIRFKYDEFVSRITCHGIQDWHGAHSKPSFVFWGVTFLVATAILIYSIYKCLNDFYTEPINTSISVTPLNSIPFPDVYICPTSFLDDSTFKNLNFEAQGRALFFTGRTEKSGGLLQLKRVVTDHFPFPAGGGGPEEVTTLPPPPPPKLVKQQQEILSASLKIDSFIPECQFSGKSVGKASSNDIIGVNSDCRHLIERKLDIDYGVCYLIRLSKSARQATPAKGLSVVVDLLTEQTYPQYTYLGGTLSDGIYVAIQAQYHPVNYQRFLVSSGTHTQISLQAKEETFVSVSAFSKTPQLCVAEGDVEFEILNVPYTREACQFDCVQQAVLHNSDPNSKCLLPVDVDAIKEKHWNITNWCSDFEILDSIESDNYSKCVSKCHRACHEKSYVITTSNHKIPSRFFREKMIDIEDHANQVIGTSSTTDVGSGENTIGNTGVFSVDSQGPNAQATQGDLSENSPPGTTVSNLNSGVSENDDDASRFTSTLSTTSSDIFTGNDDRITALHPRFLRNDFGNSSSTPSIMSASVGYSSQEPAPSTNENDIFNSEPQWITENSAPYQQNDREFFAKGGLFNVSRWEQNIIVLDISFDKLEVTSVTQSKSMTVMSLLGNLGGVSGLWLGASLFTVLQCVVFAIKLCFSFCYTKNS